MIISKRGKQAQAPTPQEISISTTEVEVYIYAGNGGQHELSPEELEHIKRVFESIRKGLDSITGSP